MKFKSQQIMLSNSNLARIGKEGITSFKSRLEHGIQFTRRLMKFQNHSGLIGMENSGIEGNVHQFSRNSDSDNNISSSAKRFTKIRRVVRVLDEIIQQLGDANTSPTIMTKALHVNSIPILRMSEYSDRQKYAQQTFGKPLEELNDDEYVQLWRHFNPKPPPSSRVSDVMVGIDEPGSVESRVMHGKRRGKTAQQKPYDSEAVKQQQDTEAARLRYELTEQKQDRIAELRATGTARALREAEKLQREVDEAKEERKKKK